MDHESIAGYMSKTELESKIDQLSNEIGIYESKIKEVNEIRLIYCKALHDILVKR